MEKKKLIVDFDDTIVYSIFFSLVNKFLKTNYSFDDFDNYYIDDIVPKDKSEKFYSSFCDDDPYGEIKIIDGAVESLEKLSKEYEIYICSGCVMRVAKYSAKLFAYKYDFLIKYFPFLNPRNFIFTNAKDVVCGDVMIDDLLSNLKGNYKKKILFTSYHNKNITKDELDKLGVVRASSWEEVCRILL